MVRLILLLALIYNIGCNRNSPIVVCQEQCDGYLNTIIKYENTTNIYSCECDNK